ncbi:MAG TPA: hypothetical protein VMS88_01470 [Terriglobales bacterium]|nr:hypothetical protein [Terriglobales bacterium]
MTMHEAEQRAHSLGLSAWMTEAIAVGQQSRTVALMCVGFASLDLALGQAETWEEAFEQAMRIIFSA